MERHIQTIIQDDKIKIGENVRKIRMERGMTQEDMATELQLRGINMSRGTYSKIEMGLRHIEATTLAELSDILNTTYDELLKPTT